MCIVVVSLKTMPLRGYLSAIRKAGLEVFRVTVVVQLDSDAVMLQADLMRAVQRHACNANQTQQIVI